MSDYHNKRAKEILQKIIYATAATASKLGVQQAWMNGCGDEGREVCEGV